MPEIPRGPERREKQAKQPLREVNLLVDQGRASGIPVVPGKDWAVHYPQNGEPRNRYLEDLLSGQQEPGGGAEILRPDGIVFDLNAVREEGFSVASDQLRDLTTRVQYTNYEELARFVSAMRGHVGTPQEAEALFSQLAHSRIQQSALDAYGGTGRRQLSNVLAKESVDVTGTTPFQRVLSALRADWLVSKQQGGITQRGQITQSLSGSERALFEQLLPTYQSYVESGSQVAYETLVHAVQENLHVQMPDGPSQEMQELDQELEPYKEDAVPPQTPGDTAIPPEDEDEYITPEPQPFEKEGSQERPKPLYEIRPAGTSTKPLVGYYASGRKSYYDRARNVWSKQKQCIPYNGVVNGSARWVISGKVDAHIQALSLPVGYAPDARTLRSQGGSVRLLRDQTGCFYVEADNQTSFSVEFLREETPLVLAPQAADVEALYGGPLSPTTERALQDARGSATDIANQLCAHVIRSHSYPGGGDLQAAQALQYKLRSENPGDTYVPALDSSPYLECYSANTLYVALLRRAGIPARLVTGHMLDSAEGSVAAITGQTGHAWSEFWDGGAWRRHDATPQPKPEDKPKQEPDKDAQPQAAPTQAAEDGGVPSPQPAPQPGDQAGEGGQPSVSDDDFSQAQQQLEQMTEQLEKMQERKQELNQELEQAKSFKELEDLKEKLKKEDLLSEMEEDLEERIQDKKEALKDDLREKVEQMADDGFLDEKKRDEMLKQLEQEDIQQLERMRQELERNANLFNAYERIREEVMPLVDEWYQYFLERLPQDSEIDVDTDSLTRRGTLDRRSTQRPRNLIFGTIRNPRVIRSVTKPLFLAEIVLDVSGSMRGEKLMSAQKLLVFFSELFSRIAQDHGYLRFAINLFSDGITQIKTFDQHYDSPERYKYTDGSNQTVKLRLMEKVAVQGGTQMLEAVQQAAKDLDRETEDYPDYASAMYFLGDGADSSGRTPQISKFMQTKDAQKGFGEHMYSAVFLGNESQRSQLSQSFGEDHTVVASNFDELVEQSMLRFDEDISLYLEDKVA